MKTTHLLFAALAFAACGETGGGTDAGTDAGTDSSLVCDPSPATVTMAQLQTQVFDVKCKSCHFPPNGEGIAYGDYTTAANTFAATVNKASTYAGSGATLKIVEPNNLKNSALWLKVAPESGTLGKKGPKGEVTGARMPNDGSSLTAEQKKLIKDWICTGATM